MVLVDLLYKLLIGPLELFFEAVYAIAFRFLNDPALAIVALSIAMNLLVLPLYRRADAVQEQQRERSLRMKPWNDHIKSAFTGDERFMIQQAYNRISGWSPTDSLKGSVSLLLEIPFFIAAYRFLSELSLLRGVPLGPIADLGSPDALLVLGGTSVNLLPILMTAINLVSAAIYMKGMPASNKVQMYGIAAIFLVLLYNSPAGLVFYWTLNNLFSLIKNVFYKLPNPSYVLAVSCAALAVLVAAGVIVLRPELSLLRALFLVLLMGGLAAPLALRKLGRNALPQLSVPEASKKDDRIFLTGCVFMALLTGALIPASVVAASPAEFIDISNYESPLWSIAGSLALATGTFVVWFGVFYRLATPRGRTVFGILLLAICIASVANYLLLGTDYGTLSPQLQFDAFPEIPSSQMVANALIAAGICAVAVLVWRRRRNLARIGYLCACVAVAVGVAVSVAEISTESEYVRGVAEAQSERTPHINMSKNGRNVVVVMLDRAMGVFVPYLVHEHPDLKRLLDGFTYYPNSLSYSAITNIASPALYGGSGYRPKQINDRDTELLVDKQNEALKVMPALFSENGFKTTVFDPSLAGYKMVPDISIFDDMPNVEAYVTMVNNPVRNAEILGSDLNGLSTDGNRASLFFRYSLFKIAPLALHPTLYDSGNYNAAKTLVGTDSQGTVSVTELMRHQRRVNASVGDGVEETFMRSYAVLKSLEDLTRISEDGDCFHMMSNDTAHEPMVLAEPECVPRMHVDNTAYDRAHSPRLDGAGNELDISDPTGDPGFSRTMHYQINMAALSALGEWFDYLREQGIWDNTRVILVSDHARDIWLDKSLELPYTDENGVPDVRDGNMFNCLLMFKDFNARGFTVDERFMTNADTPVLALKDIVDNPKNPFTGKRISSEYKNEGEQLVLYSYDWDVTSHKGTTLPKGTWYTVRDDVRKRENWKHIGRVLNHAEAEGGSSAPPPSRSSGQHHSRSPY